MAQPGEEALPGPETPVQIRVAIQEAEDVEELEDEDEGAEPLGAGDSARFLSPGWGSASEDEPGRGHR
jgi:la-related protein 6